MEPYVTSCFPTKFGYMRLRFPELRDWSGEVRVSASEGDPAEPLVVSVWSDAGSGPPLDVRIEESQDGVHWTEAASPRRLVDILGERPRSGGRFDGRGGAGGSSQEDRRHG